MRTFAAKDKKEPNIMSPLQFTVEQTKEIRSIAGDGGLTLMNHYIAIANQAKPNMEDAQLARLTGMSEKTVERIRLKLTKAKWFKRFKHSNQGEVFIMYAVGKTTVLNGGSLACIPAPKQQEN